jgi:hypothetical protein
MGVLIVTILINLFSSTSSFGASFGNPISPILHPDPLIFVAGGLSASLSHSLTVPIDVLKTLQQSQSSQQSSQQSNHANHANASSYTDNLSLKKLTTGLLPTSTGYFIQGSMKYGLYDTLKPLTT